MSRLMWIQQYHNIMITGIYVEGIYVDNKSGGYAMQFQVFLAECPSLIQAISLSLGK